MTGNIERRRLATAASDASATTSTHRDDPAPMAGTPPYPNAAYAWFVVICLQLAYAVAFVDRQIMALLVQPIRADLGISDTQFSLLVGTAFVLFYSTMGLFCGRLADSLNRRNMIVIGMTLWCVATAACGLANSFASLFLARMLVGVGEAVLSPAAYSMIADYFPKERRARAAAAYSMAISMGSGVALLFGAIVVAGTSHGEKVSVPFVGQIHAWQAVFMKVGLPGLLVAALIMLVREPVRREFNPNKSGLGEALGFIRQRASTLSLIIIGFALNGLVTYCLGTWVPVTFIRTFGWTAAQIATAQGTILLTFGMGGTLFGGWWVSRSNVASSNSNVLATARNALMLMPIFGLVLGFAPDPWIRLVGVAGLAMCGGVPSGLAAAAIYHTTPNQFRGSVLSIYLMTGTLVGFGIGVTLVAALTDYVFQSDVAVGKSLGLVVSVAAATAALLLHQALKRPDKDYA